jgi:hypothetical protein
MEQIDWEKELDVGYLAIGAGEEEYLRKFIREILTEDRQRLRKAVEGMIGTKYEYDEGNIEEMPVYNAAIRDVLALLDKDIT